MKMSKCIECVGDIVKKDKVFYQTYGNKKIRIESLFSSSKPQKSLSEELKEEFKQNLEIS